MITQSLRKYSPAGLVPHGMHLSSTGASISAAAAIQYAVEELSPDFATGTFLEAGDLRLCYAEIKSLYEDAAFPLPRDGPVAGP